MEDQVRFAVVGAGKIGQRHVSVIEMHPRASLLAVVEMDVDVRVTFMANGISCYDDLAEMLVAEPEVEVVIIASPNGLHAKQAQLCLSAGRHVVIEKPMTLSRKEAEEVIHCAFQHHRHVFVVMQNRYSPVVSWLKGLVTNGVLGRLFMVQVNLFWNRDERYYTPGSWHGDQLLDGGVLFTQFSHFVDLLYWLWGDMEEIRSRFEKWSTAGPAGFSDSGFITFDFTEGGMGAIAFSTAVAEKNMESSISIVAEKGSVKIGGQYMDEVQYCQLKGGLVDLPNREVATVPNHYYVTDNVIEVLRGHTSVATNALEGLKVVDIIRRMYDAGR